MVDKDSKFIDFSAEGERTETHLIQLPRFRPGAQQ